MELREGYKNTEVGVIPEDWEVKELGDVVTFQGGSQPALTTFIPIQKEGYIRLLQIRDYKTNKFETFIPLNLAKKFCTSNDIMIGRYGPPIFQILRGLEGAYNVALMKAIPAKEIEREFIYYFLKQDSLFSFVEKLSQRSSGQTGVDLQQLRLYPIALPTKAEQTAIANALSDADALINSHEKLIAKKHNIKQGAMQQLLKPKEGWEVKKLGDICEIRKGEQLNRSTLNDNEYYPVYNGGISASGYTSDWNQIENTIIISEGGNSCGFVNFIKTKFWQGGHCSL
jgi:type I restriction enzyme S subunit